MPTTPNTPDPWRGCILRPDHELEAVLRQKEVSTEPGGFDFIAQKAEKLVSRLLDRLQAFTARKADTSDLADGQRRSLARLRHLGSRQTGRR